MEDIIDPLSYIKERKQNILQGNVNCIPSPIKGFTAYSGLDREAKYYLVTAHQKDGKTSFASYLFLYSTLDYLYENPNSGVEFKGFYFNFEESELKVLLRYYTYLIYKLSDGRLRVTLKDLLSTTKPLPDVVENMIESDDFKDRVDFFKSHIEFVSEKNPTGCYHYLIDFLKANGHSEYKELKFTQKDGTEKTYKKFIKYIPDNPNLLKLAYFDHISLLQNERGYDLRESICKFSEYLVELRNKYNMSSCVIQQQSLETQNLDAYKTNKIRPTVAGLADSKYTSRDCNIMLGITNPFKFELTSYLNYNITEFKNNIRFLEIVLSRDGDSGDICALYFDGATCTFKTLPSPKEVTALNKFINFIKLRDYNQEKKNGIVLYNIIDEKTKNIINNTTLMDKSKSKLRRLKNKLLNL